jgi:exopolyphosphatase / guanosine-5'-triphosphate,3'-diphosphate pyrophosphatase
MRIAVLDLGTNTFNLLIARIGNDHFEPIHMERVPVKLGSGGIQQGVIARDAIERALKAMLYYREVIDSYHPDEIMAYGTSALRSTRNGRDVAALIKEKTGIGVNIISGEEEASLIFAGISVEGVPDTPYLVMDIGGGSVEFILASGQKIIWEHSFPLGIARLLEKFHPSDPISTGDRTKIEAYLDGMLSPLWEQTKEIPPTWLLGSSGTFDTLFSIAVANGIMEEESGKHTHVIPTHIFNTIFQKLIQSTYNERLTTPGLVSYRADMIVVASIFVNFVLSRLDINNILQTSYALKEGVVARRMEQLNMNKP